ncbi:SDR family oxidoreductase [Modestobacter versicolor]|uniref:NAD(P)-dependent dehydrogenase (Short-subunit alcohol dehydrogenase family) n=1 Tax=Modestobacter versicolor TaxID=429133 RepID=A0A323VBH5_9ACTN|nr:SDR family oxidoreductase [Modestobacter versicolor]MBB3676209.1 NAD(P)-dependent dehydrogenase (short-subunit alcohol dehydrogenase family) [Modestobacter versicolor]PZA21931.1 short chain dehydrogenase [Modestobacter versicolor]
MTRTWLVTGVSSGFGRQLAEQLLARGDRVAGTVRRPEAVADLVEAHGDAFSVHLLDLTDTDRIREVVDAAHAWAGRLDVVVSNAGYGLFGAAEELTDEQVRHQLDTNLLGSIQLIRAALPHLRAAGGGRVLQLSSSAGQVAWPGSSLYNAAKWGIEGFCEAVAAEVAPFGVGVTIVEPGGARTDFGHGGLRFADPLAAYDGSPAAAVRAFRDGGPPGVVGDPARMAAAMIASVDQHPAPLRLVLGTDAWTAVTATLEARLAAVLPQREVAASTDA